MINHCAHVAGYYWQMGRYLRERTAFYEAYHVATELSSRYDDLCTEHLPVPLSADHCRHVIQYYDRLDTDPMTVDEYRDNELRIARLSCALFCLPFARITPDREEID
jgi:hypothetical protein